METAQEVLTAPEVATARPRPRPWTVLASGPFRKLFAATSDNQLWWRDPVVGLVNGTIARESSAAAVYAILMAAES